VPSRIASQFIHISSAWRPEAGIGAKGGLRPWEGGEGLRHTPEDVALESSATLASLFACAGSKGSPSLHLRLLPSLGCCSPIKKLLMVLRLLPVAREHLPQNGGADRPSLPAKSRGSPALNLIRAGLRVNRMGWFCSHPPMFRLASH